MEVSPAVPSASLARAISPIPDRWARCALVDARRRALDDVELLGVAGRGTGTLCTALAPVPMMPRVLSASLSSTGSAHVAAGVVVVPARRVEAVPLEVLDTGDAGQLRAVERAGGHHDEAARMSSPRLVVIRQRLISSSQIRSRTWWRRWRRRTGRSAFRCCGSADRSRRQFERHRSGHSDHRRLGRAVGDARGLLTLRDRSKDVVISGGSNIYPREVEEVLIEQPDVSEACVVGAPDEE